MPRTPPQRTPAQQQEHERRQALAALDVTAMRAWAERYAVGLLGDDRTVLISMHETRAVDVAIPRTLKNESIAWLKEQHPTSTVLEQMTRTPEAFQGSTYGRKRA